MVPNACGGGEIAVTISRSEASAEYTRQATMNITRPYPSIMIVPNMFPLGGICPNSEYTYQIQPICGVSSYNWIFPQAWVIRSGQGTNSVTVTTGSTAQSGTIYIQASFTADCCNSISRSFQVSTLNEPPSPPYVYTGQYPPYGNNFYCGEYQVCAETGTEIGPVTHESYLTGMTWTVSAPWHFGNGVTQITTPASIWSPPVFGPADPPLNGQLCVTQTNCIGESHPTCVSFRRSIWEHWCSNSYPEWCECCEPVCPTCPPYPLMTAPGFNNEDLNMALKEDIGFANFEFGFPSVEKDFSKNQLLLIPNPTNSSSKLHIPHGINIKSIEIYTITGQLLKTISTPKHEEALDIDYPLAPGIYVIRVFTNQGMHHIKWLRN